MMMMLQLQCNGLMRELFMSEEEVIGHAVQARAIFPAVLARSVCREVMVVVVVLLLLLMMLVVVVLLLTAMMMVLVVVMMQDRGPVGREGGLPPGGQVVLQREAGQRGQLHRQGGGVVTARHQEGAWVAHGLQFIGWTCSRHEHAAAPPVCLMEPGGWWVGGEQEEGGPPSVAGPMLAVVIIMLLPSRLP